MKVVMMSIFIIYSIIPLCNFRIVVFMRVYMCVFLRLPYDIINDRNNS